MNTTTTQKINTSEARAIMGAIGKAHRLFEKSALAWEEGNNSGNDATLTRKEKECETLCAEAEKILRPYGITVTYPGLYPAYHWKENTYYTAESLSHYIFVLSGRLA